MFVTLCAAHELGAAPIRNVIVCIGDGMGVGQIAAAHCYVGTNLFFEGFPYARSITTHDAYGAVADSAAGATAIATGLKVASGVVSLALPGDGRELETLLEHFKALGKSTGLVTTSYLTDATPAAFGAHEESRYQSVQIAADYLGQTRPEVLFGGAAEGLEAAAVAAAGYGVVTNRDGLLALDASGVTRVCGLFGWAHMPFEYDGLGELPGLPDMTVKALDLLGRDPDGFFLMVEGGLIDIACHGNDLTRCVGEVLAFEAAVRAIVTWAAGREDTLVLVLADHETGGLTVVQDNGPGVLPEVQWETSGHTGAPIRLFAWGVNASLAESVSDNTQVRGVARSRMLEPGDFVGFDSIGSGVAVPQWATLSGGVYRVEFTPGLSPSLWQPCGVVTAASSRLSFVHSNGYNRSQGFYRMTPVAP